MNAKEDLYYGPGSPSAFRHAWVRILFYGWVAFFTTYAFYRAGILAIICYYLKKVVG